MDKPTENTISLLSLPKRTKGAVQSKFRKIIIDSNRFKVDVSKLSHLCIFAIRFIPQIREEKGGEKDQIIKNILPQIKQVIQDPIIKDGLIFTHKLPKETDKTITYGDHIIFLREVNRFDANKSPEMLLYFLGNVMRRVMQKLNYIQVGTSRKFINMKECMEVQNILIFSGFTLSFQMLQNGYFLTVDTTKKIVRNQSVLQFINYLYKVNPGLQRDQKRQLVKKNLLNRIIMTNYGKTRYLKVQDVLYVDLTQVILQTCKMPLTQYYKQRYDIEIKNLKQPLLFANSKKTNIKTYLIPELCLMTGIPQDFDESKNKYITQCARKTAEQRFNQIQKFVGDMNKMQGDLVFPTLGVKISSVSQKVPAKIIPSPIIKLGDGKCVPPGRQAGFSLHQSPIFKPKGPCKLGIITLDGLDSGTVIDYFSKAFKYLKIKLQMTVIKADGGVFKRGMQSIITYIQKAKNSQDCNVCLILIPNKMRHLYQRIKQTTLLQKQIGCQVVLQGTLKNKNLQSVALKILLQILAKAGHILWASVPQCRKQKIMFVAYYSCQLARQKTSNITIGICATTDDYHTQIFSKTSRYTKQHEQLQCMRQLLLQALHAYKKKNGYPPQDIIILQNQKPSRAQEMTLKFFINVVIQHMQQVYGEKRPKIVYILIRKCLHDRFFRIFEGKYQNPPIGTLINTHLTSSNFDFYLISHNICKKGGSIIPFNYKVAFSDSNIQQGVIHSLLYSQCFSYANYTGAIRIPSLLQHVVTCTKFNAEVLQNMEVPEQFRMYPYYI